jgi:hypothetical protein
MSASATRGTLRVFVRSIGVYLAQLAHLRRARQLPEAVADEDRARNLLLKQIPAVRQDGSHARPHVFAPNQSHLPDAHALNVRDCVELTRGQHADREADVSRARALLFRGRLSHEQQRD